ncbi:UNVERIFIED_CONTAM: hypothetical protein FKN15_053132 [Acipenser sinensis]
MLLSGAGDALGYRNQLWEYNQSGPCIHRELQEMGGLKNIVVQLPDWPVSDDTVLHLATAEALATGKEGEELLQEVALRYVEAMKDMEGRKPGPTSILGTSQLRPGVPGGYRIPFNTEATGCGAAMRAMCIGLRYPRPEELPDLIRVSIETGRMTHNHPTGYLGSFASALFTAFAVQRRPLLSWGAGLVRALPLAMEFVQSAGVDVEENLREWGFFTAKWEWYLSERGLVSGEGPVTWPDPYGPSERDSAYQSFSLSGWAGRSGHDAPMIALDSLLGAGPDWEELCNRAMFHGEHLSTVALGHGTLSASLARRIRGMSSLGKGIGGSKSNAGSSEKNSSRFSAPSEARTERVSSISSTCEGGATGARITTGACTTAGACTGRDHACTERDRACNNWVKADCCYWNISHIYRQRSDDRDLCLLSLLLGEGEEAGEEEYEEEEEGLLLLCFLEADSLEPRALAPRSAERGLWLSSLEWLEWRFLEQRSPELSSLEHPLLLPAASIGGDSDSTGVIAGCCWGLLHGFEGVPEGNYRTLEYRSRMEAVAKQLHKLAGWQEQ